jgi:hypothetical protein
MILGASVNYEVDGEGESNLDRAITRLFEGMPPARVAAGSAAPVAMPTIKLGRVDVRDVSLRYTDRTDPSAPVLVHYQQSGLMGVTGRGEGDLVVAIDDYLILGGIGDLLVRAGEVGYQGKLDLNLNVSDLRGWPARTRMEVRGTLIGEGEDIPALRIDGIVPLHRLSVRASATPFEKVSLTARHRRTGRTLVEFSDVRFDPLRGEFEGDLKAQASARELAAFAESFVTHDSLSAFRRLVQDGPMGPLASRSSTATLRVEGTARGSGLFQYAIVDAREDLPGLLEMDLRGTLGSVVPLDLARGVEGVDFGPLGDVVLRDPLDMTGEVLLTVNEQADRGTFWGRLSLEPPAGVLPGANLNLTLASRNDPTAPIVFRLSGAGALQGPSLPAAGPVSTTELLFPAYERILALVNGQLAATAGRLDDHAVQDSQLRLEFQTSSRRILSTLLTPIFAGFESAHSLAITLGLDRAEAGTPMNWNGNFRIDGITIDGLSTETALAGQVSFEQMGDIVTARHLSLDLVQSSQGDSKPTTFSLSMKPLFPGGPMPRSWVNLATGEGEVELQLDELNREIVGVLLRLQTFGLSERLAAPFYQRVLDLLGFRPDDPTARTKAEMTLRAAFGRKLDITSILSVRDIPSTNFFFVLPTQEIDSERFDAVLEQEIVLDRETGSLWPRKLRLALSPVGGTNSFAEISVQAEDDCRLSYGALMGLAQDEVETLAIGPANSPMAAFRSGLRSFFDRVERLRAALTAGRATVMLAVPRLDFAEFRRSAQAAGIPVEAGIFRMVLTCGITSAAQGSIVANGDFSLENLRLRSIPRELPHASGKLSLERSGETISIHEISTALRLDEKLPITTLTFAGTVQTDTADSSWTLALQRVNGAVVQALADVRTAGVGESIGVLASLPLAAIAEIAGNSGNVDLTLLGRSVSAEKAVYLDATQVGGSLIILPSLFQPISFLTNQQVRLGEDGTLELQGLHGHIDEGGSTIPLAMISLDHPLVLMAPNSVTEGTTATLTLRLEKALDAGHELFGGYKLPLFQRSLVGGRFTGLLTTQIPPGVLSGDAAVRRAVSDFAVTVEQLGLSGFDPKLNGIMEGTLEADGPVLRLHDGIFKSQLGGESMGTMRLDATYDGERGWLSSRAEIERLRPLILRALPEDLAVWAGLPESVLSLRMGWEGVPQSGKGDASLAVRGRNLALPPLATSDETVYTHDPLQIDLDAVASFDRTTTSILAREFNLHVASAPSTPVLHPFDHLTSWTTSLARARLLSPVGYRWDDLTILPSTAQGAGFEGELGPINMAAYKPLIDRYLGIPVSAGQLQGRWTLATEGAGATRRTRLASDLTLDNATWVRRDGSTVPLQARLSGTGSTRPGIVRIDDLIFRIAYPGMGPDTVDDLRFAGFVDFDNPDGRTFVDVSVASTGLQLDRMLGFYEDLQRESPAEEEAESATPSTDPLEIMKKVDGTLTVSFNDLRFRQIEFTRLSGRAQLARGTLSIEKANGLLSEGLIELSASTVIVPDAPSPWGVDVLLNNVQIAPFVNSFVDKAYVDLVSGRISSELALKGTGFSVGDLRRVEGGGAARLTEGLVVGPRLAALFGESVIEADSHFLMTGNRLLFNLSTPWNPSRDLQMNGTFRDIVAQPGGTPWVSLLGEFTRTTTVGPSTRSMLDREGRTRPYRQDLFAVRVEVDGPLGTGVRPTYRLRNIDY